MLVVNGNLSTVCIWRYPRFNEIVLAVDGDSTFHDKIIYNKPTEIYSYDSLKTFIDLYNYKDYIFPKIFQSEKHYDYTYFVKEAQRFSSRSDVVSRIFRHFYSYHSAWCHSPSR